MDLPLCFRPIGAYPQLSIVARCCKAFQLPLIGLVDDLTAAAHLYISKKKAIGTRTFCGRRGDFNQSLRNFIYRFPRPFQSE
jgi:hypothetical protein